ncbi:MAG: restriction endonuclease subunit S, partial [Bacteroidota bacterium]
LKPGQIVLAGKGHRLFAWAYRPECGSIVPSSVFFVIEPDPSLAIPEYLTIFLNLPKQRTFFHALGAGTNIPSIRKSELANMSILLPPLETQKQIVTVSQLHKQELVLMEQLRTQKQALLQSLITQLIQQ